MDGAGGAAEFCANAPGLFVALATNTTTASAKALNDDEFIRPPRSGERLADNGGWLTSRSECVKKTVAVGDVRARQSASRESWVTNQREPIRA